jgi:hypothetical protein
MFGNTKHDLVHTPGSGPVGATSKDNTQNSFARKVNGSISDLQNFEEICGVRTIDVLSLLKLHSMYPVF